MQSQQLSFDDLFNSVFLGTTNEMKLKVGDLLSVIDKKTLEHDFDIVVEAEPGYIKTHTWGVVRSPENMRILTDLIEIPSEYSSKPAYENDNIAIAKTDSKCPFAEYNRVGLLGAFSKQHVMKAHARMGIKNRNQ